MCQGVLWTDLLLVRMSMERRGEARLRLFGWIARRTASVSFDFPAGLRTLSLLVGLLGWSISVMRWRGRAVGGRAPWGPERSGVRHAPWPHCLSRGGWWEGRFNFPPASAFGVHCNGCAGLGFGGPGGGQAIFDDCIYAAAPPGGATA